MHIGFDKGVFVFSGTLLFIEFFFCFFSPFLLLEFWLDMGPVVVFSFLIPVVPRQHPRKEI